MWQSADDDAGGLTLPQLASPSQQGASCAQERWREDSSPHGTTPRRAAKTQSAPGMRPLGSRGGSASSSTALKQAFGLTPNALQRLAGSGGADQAPPRRNSFSAYVPSSSSIHQSPSALLKAKYGC